MEGFLVALTSPTAAEHEAEFNRWYDEEHAPQALALDGFESLRRYRAAAQVAPPAELDIPRYMAIFTLSDVDAAMAALAAAGETMGMSEVVDLQATQLTVFTKVFDSDAKAGAS